jgi:AbrB family looped-hinge helix DNA binding protein
MITSIDKAGRLVVPKAMRAALGLADGGEVSVELEDGRLVVSPAPVPKHIEMRDGWPVVVADGPIPPLTTKMVREVLESIRR